MSRAKNNKNVAITMPANLTACHALIEQLACTVDSLTNANETLRQEKEEIELAFNLWMHRIFAKRSERYLDDPNQLKLDLGGDDNAADAAEGLAQAIEEAALPIKAHVRRVRKPHSESLPENLPRYEVEANVPEEVKNCPEHGPRKLIGHDTTETLEFERPKLRVRVTKYAKYACPQESGCGVASPERPTGLVEGDRYDTSVAAEIITGKYGYHLPVYRQQDLFAGSGWTPARSTLLNILTAAAFVLEPLIEHFKQAVLADDIVGTDDTHVTLLLPQTIPKPGPNDPKSQRVYEVLSKAAAEKRRSVTARMWAYRGITVPLNVFDFTVSWHRDGPELMLADFQGILQADCYAGYEGIALGSEGRIRRAACVAHARRKVFDAKESYPLESAVVLAKFQELYDIEDRAKALSPEERLALRQTAAVPVWADLEAWLDSEAAVRALPKSRLGKAIGYLRNHWKPLQTYLTDGRIPIDNNDVEQLMKQVALGRKNWLFIGSVAAGARAAGFLTLVSSALRNDLDVWAYIKDVLDRLLAGETDYASMRPDAWRVAHPEAIRQYRVAERRDRADRKQYRRAARRQSRRKSNP
ncbi:MAG: IS66 family transposase [Planctomycetes bacterium]|nr:IS66 family transposase [Planctomycetota bacterium]